MRYLHQDWQLLAVIVETSNYKVFKECDLVNQSPILCMFVGSYSHSRNDPPFVTSKLWPPSTNNSDRITIVRALGWSEIQLALDYLKTALSKTEKLVCQEIITILGRLLEPKLKT